MNLAGSARARLEGILKDALLAADPAAAVSRAVSRVGDRVAVDGRPVEASARIIALAVGKAAYAMAAALESIVGERLAGGLAVVPAGQGGELRRFRLCESAHPVPDESSERAGRAAIQLARSAAAEDVFLLLLSGGASSLMSCPAAGLSIRDLASTTRHLLASGAGIDELNAVRKHLGAIGGGLLARHLLSHRAELLVISDVRGDRLDVIGSGPLSPDPTTYLRALEILERRGIRGSVPARVVEHLEAGVAAHFPETLKAGDPALACVRVSLLASNGTARARAVAAARQAGYLAIDLGESLTGEARVAGRRLAALARSTLCDRPVCLISGGETVVTVRGSGQGGRNQELALAAAVEWAGKSGLTMLSAGTDGVDGPTPAAGAVVDGETLARGEARGADGREALADNDSHGFLSAAGDLLVTGPSGTNVMDLVLIEVGHTGQKWEP